MNTTKEAFLANMSHEIRTPLNAINGYSQMLANSSDKTEKQQIIEKIRKNSHELTVLIDNILEISKIESGKIAIHNANTCLIEILEQIKETMQKRAYDKGLSFSIITVGQVPTQICTDKYRVIQILINLIGNAIKFTEAGSVTLEVRTKSETSPDAELLFSIIDTGIGISEKYQKNLFDKFSQLDESNTRLFGGIGLGLALSQRLAKQLHGDVILKQSKPSEGSVFCLRLPYGQQCHEQSVNPYNKQINSPVQLCLPIETDLLNKKILLVDDSEDNRQIFKYFLKSAGAIVENAENGKIAIEKIKNTKYDFILMDIQMPVMDGLEATKKIRSLKYRKPVIALTAHASSESKINCLKSGFTDLISKPVTRRSLIESILFILDQNRR